MVSIRARLFWENGVPLRDAWLHFASDNDQRLLSEIPQAFDAVAQFASNHAGHGIKTMFKAFALEISAAQARRDREAMMKDELLTDLFNDQFVATGYRERPSLGSSPVLIEAQHFDESVADWEHCKMNANGRIWNRVRISTIKLPSRKIHSSCDAIDVAIYALSSKSAEFVAALRKIQCNLVREKLGKKYSIGNGLSDQNIAKRIVLICGNKRIIKI